MTADLADLRIALGIDRVDIYGIAAAAARARAGAPASPKASAAWCSTPPVAQGDVLTELWPSRRHASTRSSPRRRDRACNTAYPDLDRTTYELVDTLDDDPVRATAVDPDAGAAATVVFDGANFIEVFRSGLYDTDLIPLFPVLSTGSRRVRASTRSRSGARPVGTGPVQCPSAAVDCGTTRSSRSVPSHPMRQHQTREPPALARQHPRPRPSGTSADLGRRPGRRQDPHAGAERARRPSSSSASSTPSIPGRPATPSPRACRTARWWSSRASGTGPSSPTSAHARSSAPS